MCYVFRPISQRKKSKPNKASSARKTDNVTPNRSTYNGICAPPPLVIITTDAQNDDHQKGENRNIINVKKSILYQFNFE